MNEALEETGDETDCSHPEPMVNMK